MAKHARGEQEHTCCGVIEEAREKRARKREKPHSWLVLKFAVGLTVAIIAYAFYVYIGRLCVPMIRRDRGDLSGGRATGIGFLVVFSLFGLMMLWAYAKARGLDPPGLARDHVQKSSQPKTTGAVPAWWDSDSDLGGAVYQENSTAHHARSDSHRNGEFPAPGHFRDTRPCSDQCCLSDGPHEEANAGITDALPPVADARAARSPASPQATEDGTVSSGRPMMHTRRPPTTPQLLPEYRYCRRDGFVKPLRAHHCRACGTCVLRYDHHCPWVGQCVGARNHKFFIIFIEWALAFCTWTFATLLAQVVKAGYYDDIDPQEVVIIVLSGLFALFTFALLLSHVSLIIQNLTTVDSLNIRRIKEREKHVLARMHSWYQFRAKRATRRQWDAEWGRINEEGNIWSLGGSRQNWEALMGHHVWEWFLPVGRSDSDGLSYPINPRFDAEGRWRPRREWPPELR
ncbi:zf-DHHC-domain-containing protein [Amylocystis lapponica]|nr:zf-DHHC-domain-containing protein [Amylocystis lapponica]